MKLHARQIFLGTGTLLLATVFACAGNVEGSTPPTISPDIFAPIPTPRPFGQTPTPTATPFIVVVPTPEAFATVTVPGTPEPTATPSPTIGAPGPEPTAISGATPEPTVQATPVVEPTATATSTEEPAATPEPTATPTPVAVASAPGAVEFFVEQAAITLDPDHVPPDFISSGTDLTNFSATVLFDNPINGSFRDFSYGVKFRESEGLYQVISINSAGEVRYLEGTTNEDNNPDTFVVIQNFVYNDVATSGSGTNSLHLTVIDDQGWLFVNNVFISQFGVGAIGVSSDVQFVAELENETQISGAQTELFGVEVRSGGSAATISNATMIKEAGEITRTEPTGTTRDFMVEAEFVSGYERILGRWSVGFEFTDPASDTTHWVVMDNSRQWKLFRQSGIDGDIEEIDGGTHNGILRDRGDVNSLRVFSHNGTQQLMINGVLVSSFSIQPDLAPVQISAFSGFTDADQQPGFPTQINNYGVWSFGN